MLIIISLVKRKTDDTVKLKSIAIHFGELK